MLPDRHGGSRMNIVHYLAAGMLLHTAAFAAEIRLEDGSLVKGEIMERNDSVVVIVSESLGELRGPVRRVVGGLPAPADAKDARMAPRDRDPSGNALFFLPTAFTPQQGAFTFRDFELLFLTLGYAATDATSITFGALFPITSEFQLFTAGFKQQLGMSEDRTLAVALTGSFTKPVSDEVDGLDYLVNGNLVVSRRFPGSLFADAFGLHGVLGYAGVSYKDESYDYDCYCYRSERRWEDNLSFGGGAEFRLTPTAKFMVEYLNAFPFSPEESEVGVFTIGFRLHGTRLSADIAGFRPVTDEDMGDLFLYPLLNVGYRF
jgi:hypothetical protein